MQVGNNNTVEWDHIKLLPWESNAHGSALTVEFSANNLDTTAKGHMDDYTAECILLGKREASTAGWRLYKVQCNGFAAVSGTRELPCNFVPQYTSMRLHYLKAKHIKLDINDLLVHIA